MRPRPLALLLVALAVAGVASCALVERDPPAVAVLETARPSVEPTPATVVVDVQGAVARPGVYRLAAGTRVGDAIAAAGGALPEADPAGLNRAAALRDGSRVYLPVRGEVPPAGTIGSDAERRVNLNQATPQELAALPGIGPSTADRIVRSRDKAPFRNVEELQTRGLVSARVLADVRDVVSVR